MAKRLNDGGMGAPRVRKDMNAMTFHGLPTWSSGPKDELDVVPALEAAGIEGIQSWTPGSYAAAGLREHGMARVLAPEHAQAAARRGAELGLESTTVLVGDGFETQAEGELLVGAVLEASARHDHLLLIETHRGTLTQDVRRTLDLIERFPDLGLTADLSHWYTGLELTFGDFEAKLDRLTPAFERVRMIHGRIGDSGCMQVGLSVDPRRPAISHFEEMWRRCSTGFLAGAGPGDILPFAAELLPPTLVVQGVRTRINYARLVPDEHGELREESDRWSDAEALWGLACAAFGRALKA